MPLHCVLIMPLTCLLIMPSNHVLTMPLHCVLTIHASDLYVCRYREHYQLYEGKPCITDTADECRKCLNARISMIGKKVRDSIWGEWAACWV